MHGRPQLQPSFNILKTLVKPPAAWLHTGRLLAIDGWPRSNGHILAAFPVRDWLRTIRPAPCACIALCTVLPHPLILLLDLLGLAPLATPAPRAAPPATPAQSPLFLYRTLD
jgi:hypothetical protein